MTSIISCIFQLQTFIFAFGHFFQLLHSSLWFSKKKSSFFLSKKYWSVLFPHVLFSFALKFLFDNLSQGFAQIVLIFGILKLNQASLLKWMNTMALYEVEPKDLSIRCVLNSLTKQMLEAVLHAKYVLRSFIVGKLKSFSKRHYLYDAWWCQSVDSFLIKIDQLIERKC